MGPEEAFRRARSAVDWLLEHSRISAGASLLLDENISYGFQRNLLGLKPFGIALSVTALVVHGLLLALAMPTGERLWLGVAICIPLTIFLFGWVFLVTKGAVAEASLAYAQRLLAFCEAPAKSPRARLCCQRLPRALQCQQSRGSVKRLPSRKICDGKGRRSVIREYPINGTGFHGTVSATRPIALKVTMIYAI